MTENFFLDNHDLQYHLDKLDLREVLELKEKGYSYSKEYPTAPRNYEDAKDNYRIFVEVLGDICANVANSNGTFEGWKYDGNARAVYAREISHSHLKCGDAGTGVPGTDYGVGPVELTELGKDRDRAAWLLSQ